MSEPHWLPESYQTAIAALDTGLVRRNLSVAEKLVAILHRIFPDGPYLDVGAGHGLLVRHMRDRGFDFRWADQFAENHYARGFEDDGREYEVVTAVEVLEHLELPVEAVRNWIDKAAAHAFVFTQETFEGSPPPHDWWYYTPITGQHISFFQPRTLQRIGEILGMHYSTIGGLHVFTRDRLPAKFLDNLLAHPRVVPLLSRYIDRKRTSLTEADFEMIAASVRTEPR